MADRCGRVTLAGARGCRRGIQRQADEGGRCASGGAALHSQRLVNVGRARQRWPGQLQVRLGVAHL